MGDVIDFKSKPDAETIKLFLLSGNIDSIIKQAVSDGIDIKDIAAVLANRLGELCGVIEKSGLGEVVGKCIDLTRKQYSDRLSSTEE